jgi:NitT/TauT family transport system substrate-binding protein
VKLRAILVLLFAIVWLSACGRSSDETILQFNWVAEPEFGGYYAAKAHGYFEAEGLHLKLSPGGPSIPTLQLVASGQAQFGIADADAILVARERGVPLVALFSLYQTFPQGIMVHAARKLSSIEAVFQGGTLSIMPGTPYYRMLEQRFGFKKTRIVPYLNNIAPFLHDPDFAQQCYVTAEPVTAKRAGADPEVFLIKDIGYNPYSGVIFAREDYVRSHLKETKALLRAVRKGWADYLAQPEPINALMHTENPTMDLETFTLASEAQKPFITGELPEGQPLGAMASERWKRFSELLIRLGLLKSDQSAGVLIDEAALQE